MTDKQDNQTIKNRLVADLKRDKKKTAVLGILVIVALVVVLKTVLKGGSPARPRTVAAAPAQSSDSSIRSLPNDPVQMARALSREKDSAQKERPRIDRDIFKPDPQYFPPRVKKDTKTDAQQKESSNQKQQRIEAHRQMVLAQSKALSLQSTVVSDVPIAIINGKVLREGEWISGFKVVDITARSCEVKKEGVSIILTMKSR